MTDSRRHNPLELEGSTIVSTENAARQQGRLVPALTILGHPDPRRVGDRKVLNALPARGLALSRTEPKFAAPTGGTAHPLEDMHLSRKAILLRGLPDGGLVVQRGPARAPIEVDGEKLLDEYRIDADSLHRGVTLLLFIGSPWSSTR